MQWIHVTKNLRRPHWENTAMNLPLFMAVSYLKGGWPWVTCSTRLWRNYLRQRSRIAAVSWIRQREGLKIPVRKIEINFLFFALDSKSFHIHAQLLKCLYLISFSVIPPLYCYFDKAHFSFLPAELYYRMILWNDWACKETQTRK